MTADIHNYKMRVESGLRSLDHERFADEDKALLRIRFQMLKDTGTSNIDK